MYIYGHVPFKRGPLEIQYQRVQHSMIGLGPSRAPPLLIGGDVSEAFQLEGDETDSELARRIGVLNEAQGVRMAPSGPAKRVPPQASDEPRSGKQVALNAAHNTG